MKLTLTFEIEIADIPEKDRLEMLNDAGMEDEDMPRISAMSEPQVRAEVTDAFYAMFDGSSYDDQSDMWAGSNFYGYITSIVAASSPQAEVGVKPLDWRGNEASSPVGNYRIQRLSDKWEPLHNGHYMLPRVHGMVEAFDTPEEARAFVKADYEKNVRSALEDPSPAPDVTMLLQSKADTIRTEYQLAYGRPCDCSTPEGALQYGRAQGLEIAADIISAEGSANG